MDSVWESISKYASMVWFSLTSVNENSVTGTDGNAVDEDVRNMIVGVGDDGGREVFCVVDDDRAFGGYSAAGVFLCSDDKSFQIEDGLNQGVRIDGEGTVFRAAAGAADPASKDGTFVGFGGECDSGSFGKYDFAVRAAKDAARIGHHGPGSGNRWIRPAG